ncbi:hypothetical protein WME90_44990 [Sorangium sp. So ce375]|uniref:hypothetical protein n=1 Tax=Sorangium sp. So ce375 TaxID=3133306 RepID=UPI003F5BEC97
MSAFGPALFVRRTDGRDLDEREQQAIVEMVHRATRKLGVTDEHDEAIEPRRHDYGETEAGALCVLLYSSYNYYGMPEEVMADQDETWKELGMKVAREVEAAAPGAYRFDCYTIED